MNVSVPTLDDAVWRTTEPGTAPPRRRLEIVRRLVDAGIRTNVASRRSCRGSRTHRSSSPRRSSPRARPERTTIWANVLNLRPGTREHFLDCLARDWPEERARYERLYGDRSYLPREAISVVTRQVGALAREHASNGRPPLRPRPVPTQLTLV